MILFIIGALFTLIALAVLIFSDDAKRAAIIPAVVAVIFIGISCVSYVPTGYTGIVTTFGKVEDGTKDAGVVFKAPWQSIVKMDNRVQEMSMDLSAFSSDIQEVSTSVAVGYRINQANAMTIYKEVGKKYEDTLITPRVLETVKAVVAHYDASSLISNRDAVASQMDTKLREVLAQYNIDLQYISVTNFDFTDTFTDAVEAKVKAQQEKEKAETDADKRRVEAQATADADLIAANAEAEKSKVAADAELYVAEKKAEANRALNDSLNSNLLEYYKITDVESRWNGELPMLATVTAFLLSTASTDLLEPPGAAAPFYVSIGNRPRPVQARKCPPKQSRKRKEKRWICTALLYTASTVTRDGACICRTKWKRQAQTWQSEKRGNVQRRFIRGSRKQKNQMWRWSEDETFRADKDGQAAACLQCFP